MCNYRETYARGVVQVLARGASRCGPPQRIGGTSVTTGGQVRVPAAGPDELVYARLHLPRPLGERLRELVWKPSSLPAIVLDGVAYRLVAATASGPLLMRMPPSTGISPNTLSDAHVRTSRLENVPAPIGADFYAVRVGSTPGPPKDSTGRYR